MRPDLHADALWMKEIRADRDVIMWDYRGLNFSPSSLFCPSEVAAPNPTERDAIATAYENEGLDTSINGDAAQNAAFWTEVFESNGYIRCADYFRNELGMDISLYSTESAVRDVVALMEHLGYPAYNVYGGSYGSYVVTELLRFYDENDSEALLCEVRNCGTDR